MKRAALFIFAVFVLIAYSCTDESNDNFRERIHADYKINVREDKLSSGSKATFINIEKSLNTAYVNDLDSLVESAFERQLKVFEDNELGFFSSWSNMFSWLFKSKQAWDDEMKLISNRYFNTLEINKEQHELYEKYLSNIKNIRQQFISSNDLPLYTQVNLPSERISLDSFSEHTRNNIAIELGSNLFEWLLGFIICFIILFFVDKIAGLWGCLIDIIVFIVILGISIVMSNSNDSRLMNSLREQYTQGEQYNYEIIKKSLDENTLKFYEHL